MDDIDTPILPDAHVNGTGAARTATSDTDVSADSSTLKPSFLAGLASAMRDAAARERDRISGVVAGDAAAHVDKVRSRAAVETEELRRLAEEDVQHIEQWSASEIERVKSEASQKIDDRRTSLDDYLKQHDAIIETEIEGVNEAVRQYGETLDRFFAELADTTDPSEIARRAERLPQPPDLDDVRSAARAKAMAKFAESEAPDATAEPMPEATAEAAEPVAAEAAAAPAMTTESAGADDATEAGTMIGVMDDGATTVEPSETLEAAPDPVAAAEAVTADAVPEPVVGEAEPIVAEAEAEPVVAEAEAEPVVAEAEAEPVMAEAHAEPAPDVAATTEAAPAEAPTPAPVAVMDPDAQRVPAWPAPAPAEPAQISPTIDHTSAAVRLLRSVAPWTAPTHVGSRSEGDAE